MEGLLQLTYLPTSNQLADIFTKILPSTHFQQLLSKLELHTTPKLEGDLDILPFPFTSTVIIFTMYFILFCFVL